MSPLSRLAWKSNFNCTSPRYSSFHSISRHGFHQIFIFNGKLDNRTEIGPMECKMCDFRHGLDFEQPYTSSPLKIGTRWHSSSSNLNCNCKDVKISVHEGVWQFWPLNVILKSWAIVQHHTIRLRFRFQMNCSSLRFNWTPVIVFKKRFTCVFKSQTFMVLEDLTPVITL